MTRSVCARLAGIMLLALISVSTSLASLAQESDPGVDVCFINVKVANLREEPSTSSAVIRKLRQGEMLVLLERYATGDWYNVIHVESGDEGWLHNTVIDIRYTSKPAGPSPFSVTRRDSYSNPNIVITNDSYKTLSLSIGSTKYSIPSYTTRTITVPAGTYKYVASAPGVIPLLGTKNWEVGSEYTWKFWIETTRR